MSRKESKEEERTKDELGERERNRTVPIEITTGMGKGKIKRAGRRERQ